VFIARGNNELAGWSLTHWPRVCVPTMGALHEGHLELVRRGVAYCAERRWPPSVVVTVFVNPTQFNDAGDFQRYPKMLEEDCALCDAAGAACVFAPTVADMYPGGAIAFAGELPAVATEPGLEDALRPGHFAGVYQVVERLFRLVQPAAAVFGEKDWQQLQVVRALVAGSGLPVDVVGVPTVREADGLAMSSRNRFLSVEERRRSLALVRALRAAGQQATPTGAEAAMRHELEREGIVPDYAVVREGRTLRAVGDDAGGVRAVIAAKVGSVRLLDNGPWPGTV